MNDADGTTAGTRDEEGATATEYGLLVGFLALMIVVGATAFGTALDAWFDELAAVVVGWNVP